MYLHITDCIESISEYCNVKMIVFLTMKGPDLQILCVVLAMGPGLDRKNSSVRFQIRPNPDPELIGGAHPY
jgi:hypothetical protein